MPRLYSRIIVCCAILLLAVSLPAAGQNTWDITPKIDGSSDQLLDIAIAQADGKGLISVFVFENGKSLYQVIPFKTKRNGKIKFKKPRDVSTLSGDIVGDLLWNPASGTFLFAEYLSTFDRGVQIRQINAKGRLVGKPIHLDLPEGWAVENPRLALLQEEQGGPVDGIAIAFEVSSDGTFSGKAKGLYLARIDQDTLKHDGSYTFVSGLEHQGNPLGIGTPGPYELSYIPGGGYLLIAGRIYENPFKAFDFKIIPFAYLLSSDDSLKQGPLQLSNIPGNHFSGRWITKKALLFSGRVETDPTSWQLLMANKRLRMKKLVDPQRPTTESTENIVRWVRGTADYPLFQVTRNNSMLYVDTLEKKGRVDKTWAEIAFDKETPINGAFLAANYNLVSNSIIIVYELSNDDSVTWEAMEIKLDEVP